MSAETADGAGMYGFRRTWPRLLLNRPRTVPSGMVLREPVAPVDTCARRERVDGDPELEVAMPDPWDTKLAPAEEGVDERALALDPEAEVLANVRRVHPAGGACLTPGLTGQVRPRRRPLPRSSGASEAGPDAGA